MQERAHQVIAKTLSGAPQPQHSVANLSGQHIFRVQLETIILEHSGISTVYLETFREQTAMALKLQRLSFLILTGWSTDNRKVAPLVRLFLTVKDE